MKVDKKVRAVNIKIIYVIIGLLLIVVNFALNERIISDILPAYRISTPTSLRMGIFVLDVLFAVTLIFVLVRRQPKSKIMVDLLVGIGFALILLVGIELAFSYLNFKNRRQIESVEFTFINDTGTSRNVQFTGEHAQAFFQRDDWLGYKLVPNMQVIASRKTTGQELLYKVQYSIDAQGRRVTPIDNLEPDSRFILFFGGSYTFGEGVNDNQTMPAYVSQFVPKYRAYNYGVGGYGPQHMLAQLQSDDITQHIDEEQGILVYTFINEHIDRGIGSMLIHNQRGDVMPYYYLDADNNLIRKGDLVSGRPLQSVLFAVVGKSQTLKYFNINIPLKTGNHDYETVAKMIEESRRIFENKFNSGQFYVVIYPGRGAPLFYPYLDAVGITYFDYSEIPEIYNDDFWLGEGHPSAKGHRIVAERLVDDLGLLNGTDTQSAASGKVSN